MTPEETATATAGGISQVVARFMFDPATYARGDEIGLGGIEFYFAGRGGVLGPVDADVVTAALVFFEPGTVRTHWEAGIREVDPFQAARAWAGAAHDWGETHLPDDVDLDRLATLATRVVDGAHPGGAPIFAGWRRLARPTGTKARATHELNGLRELRGALHGGAVLASGLRPVEAVLLHTPGMAGLLGWSEPHPDVGALEGRWQEAEAATNRALASAFAILDDLERTELAALVGALHPRGGS